MFLPTLKIDSSLITPYVLLPGDPDRVEVIGKKLKNFEIKSQNREFTIGVGSYRGLPITVCSTGIGCPSAAIAIEELIRAGAKVLIRVGTCGGAWRADIPAGSLIISTASIRDEGTTQEYIPLGFPAVADFSVIQALVKAAEESKQKYFVGINRTHDAFYGANAAITKWGNYLLDKRWQNQETPILSSEMECAALFVIASLRGVQAGAILAVNADPEPLKARVKGQELKVVSEISTEATQEVVEKAIEVALQTVIQLAK